VDKYEKQNAAISIGNPPSKASVSMRASEKHFRPRDRIPLGTINDFSVHFLKADGPNADICDPSSKVSSAMFAPAKQCFGSASTPLGMQMDAIVVSLKQPFSQSATRHPNVTCVSAREANEEAPRISIVSGMAIAEFTPQHRKIRTPE
jgi:hypothetical protein